MKESLCKVPSLDEAAEVVAIDRQDHTFEFKDLLNDREELRSGHKKDVLGQQDPVGLSGPVSELAPLPMRSKWETSAKCNPGSSRSPPGTTSRAGARFHKRAPRRQLATQALP